MRREHKKPVIGMITGGVVTLLGPLFGLLTTIFMLRRAFVRIPDVSASRKFAVLAQWISESMYATAFGLCVGAIGLIATLVSVVFLLRARPDPLTRTLF